MLNRAAPNIIIISAREFNGSISMHNSGIVVLFAFQFCGLQGDL